MSDDLSLPRSEREMYKNDSHTHIESLLKEQINKLTNERTVLEEIVESQSYQLSSLVKQVVVLTKMRDEARREICMISCGKGGRSSSVSPDAIEEAKRRGWDCFKDNP